MSTQEDEIHEPEVVNETALARPSIPTTVNELASLESRRGVEIVEQRLQIFDTMRVASLKLTMPNDWTLFKGPQGITAFLGDQGCDRIKKLWGISVVNLGAMERIEDSAHPGEFAYRITGDGMCGLTGESVTDMEGVRYSTERYATEKPEGIQRTVAVQKAARANLDGGITRELAGLKSVPVEELDKAWQGSWKKSSQCNLGRGFGSGDERAGGAAEKTGIDQADVPTCSFCKDEPKLVFRAATDKRKAFWGCRNYASHPKDKVYVDHEELLARIAKKKTAADDREPGQEG